MVGANESLGVQLYLLSSRRTSIIVCDKFFGDVFSGVLGNDLLVLVDQGYRYAGLFKGSLGSWFCLVFQYLSSNYV